MPQPPLGKGIMISDFVLVSPVVNFHVAFSKSNADTLAVTNSHFLTQSISNRLVVSSLIEEKPLVFRIALNNVTNSSRDKARSLAFCPTNQKLKQG